MKRIEIEFSQGGKFVATLLEKEAPKTCETVWKNLSHEAEIIHAFFAGQVLCTLCKFRITEMENPKVLGMSPGDVTFATQPWIGSNELGIIYGPLNLYRTWNGWNPVNHFAKIEEGLDELFKVGNRLHRKGVEKVTIRRV